jgi:fatty-acyl-CoA synthase
LPFFFTGGLVAVALATRSRGGAVLLQEVFDAGETLKLMSAHRCTTLFAWPHQAEALIVHPDFATAKLHLHKGVGANTKWAGRLYPSDHRAVGTWGMTETGPMATASSHDDPLEIRAGAHGRAMPGLELRVIDPETGREIVAGEEGELLVRGGPLMQQYYKVARTTASTPTGSFIPATSPGSAPTACCTSWAGSRTSSRPPASTSLPPRSKPCCSSIRR